MKRISSIAAAAIVCHVCIAAYAHTDTVIKLEGDALVGLPDKYQPATFSISERKLTIGERTVMLPDCVLSRSGKIEGTGVFIRSSWYHDPGWGGLPHYISIYLWEEEPKNHVALLLDLDTLEILKFEKRTGETELWWAWDTLEIGPDCVRQWQITDLDGNIITSPVWGEELEAHGRWEEAAEAHLQTAADGSREALERAVELLFALGEHERAWENARKYKARYWKQDRTGTARLRFTWGLHLLKRAEESDSEADWKKVFDFYSAFLKETKGVDVSSERVRAHVIVGRGHEKLGRTEKAKKAYWRAIDEYDPEIRKKEKAEERARLRAEAAERRRQRALERRSRGKGIITYLSSARVPISPFSPSDMNRLLDPNRDWKLPPALHVELDESHGDHREYERHAGAAEAKYRLAELLFDEAQQYSMPPFEISEKTSKKVERWWRRYLGKAKVREFYKYREDRRRLARWGEWSEGRTRAEQEAAVEKKERGEEGDKQHSYWIHHQFKPWMEEKSQLVEQARKLFSQVVPFAVPRWEIAAAARVGDMDYHFFKTLRNAPWPPSIQMEPGLIEVYESSMDSYSRRWGHSTMVKYEYCVALSIRHSWFDGETRHCIERLNEMEPKEHPPLREIAPTQDQRLEILTPFSPILKLENGQKRGTRSRVASQASEPIATEEPRSEDAPRENATVPESNLAELAAAVTCPNTDLSTKLFRCRNQTDREPAAAMNRTKCVSSLPGGKLPRIDELKVMLSTAQERLDAEPAESPHRVTLLEKVGVAKLLFSEAFTCMAISHERAQEKCREKKRVRCSQKKKLREFATKYRTEALTTFEEIRTKHPDTRLTPLAAFSLAEHYIDQDRCTDGWRCTHRSTA